MAVTMSHHLLGTEQKSMNKSSSVNLHSTGENTTRKTNKSII